MAGNETQGEEQSPPVKTDEHVINVPFPYPSSAAEEPATKEPILKIDYTAIAIPRAKRTINVRRGGAQTRIVQLEASLLEGAGKTSEQAAGSGKKGAHSETLKNDELGDTLQKLLKNIGSIGLAAQENQRHYLNVATALEKQSAALPKLDALQKHLEQSRKVETANQRLFDVMHAELKGYKDNFLFDALQKPIIRDLLTLFDDLCGQTKRIARFIGENPADEAPLADWPAELQASHDNLDNTVFFIIEMLNRLDVVMIESEDTVLDLKHHKVVGFEPTDLSEEKNQIVRVIRPGFLWRDRVLRPTEVVVKKFTPPEEV